MKGSSERPHVTQRVTLEGVAHVLRFDWNGREGRWYFSVFIGADALCGRKLAASVMPTIRRAKSKGTGAFAVLDRTGGGDPGIDDFATGRCALAYLTAAEVAALPATLAALREAA